MAHFAKIFTYSRSLNLSYVALISGKRNFWHARLVTRKKFFYFLTNGFKLVSMFTSVTMKINKKFENRFYFSVDCLIQFHFKIRSMSSIQWKVRFYPVTINIPLRYNVRLVIPSSFKRGRLGSPLGVLKRLAS